MELGGKVKVRVNAGCPSYVKMIRAKDGFIYELSDAGMLVTGLSIIQRGIPLASEDAATSAKVGDQYTFLGVASLPTEFGAIHTALVEDSTGKRSYTKVNNKIVTLILTKLSLGKKATAKITEILFPGGKRKHYDAVWGR